MRISILQAALAIGVWIFCVGLAYAGCPNRCNSRGVCSSNGTCICDYPFTAAPDCSLRKQYLYY